MNAEKKYKLVALFGASGSGKDTVKNLLAKKLDAHIIIPSTTRPMREGESEGNPYHFLTHKDFTEKMVIEDAFIEVSEFNGWFYGTEYSELKADKINIGIFNPQSMECLFEEEKYYNLIPIQIFAFDKTLLLRALNREKNPNCQEICRRFLADKEDFNDLDHRFDNHKFLIFNNNNDLDIGTDSLAAVIRQHYSGEWDFLG